MPKSILLVEDSEDDAFFLVRAFKKAGLQSPILHVEDGDAAMSYLSGSGPYSDRTQYPMPSLILLDVKMPFTSGFEVLRWIRQESEFPQVPVLMCTSSNQECDVEQAYALGANAYLMKPNHGEDYSDLAGLVQRFWLEVNISPQPPLRHPQGSPACSPSPHDPEI